jgi:hypothetical protein
MKVALCLYGQPRNIESPLIDEGFGNWILKKYSPDVFAHAWISGESRGFPISDWSSSWPEVKENLQSEKIIKEKFSPKKFIFEQPRIFSLGGEARKKALELELFSENNESNILSQLHSISQSLRLLEGNYDWVFLCRYDIYIKELPNLEDLDPSKLYVSDYYSHFSDNVVFGGMKAIMTQDIADSIDSLCFYVKKFSPEEFKRVAYSKLNTPEGRVKIRYGILRGLSDNSLQV